MLASLPRSCASLLAGGGGLISSQEGGLPHFMPILPEDRWAKLPGLSGPGILDRVAGIGAGEDPARFPCHE